VKAWPWLLVGAAGATLGSIASVRPVRGQDTQELTVFAAASLREAFQGLARDFEQRHAGVRVRLNFAGSQELRVQIEQGARADVFASADRRHLLALERQGLASPAHVFARNLPVVIVPTANPGKLTGFSDLPGAARIVVGAAEVPIGAYTDAILAKAEVVYGKKFRTTVLAHIRSRELDVRQVLAKVALGEADAGIVYQTDALAAQDKVTALAIPESMNVMADYPIAVLSAAPAPALAAEWVAAVLAPPGQHILGALGFRPVGATGHTGQHER
jgi:molybdate transport system substrate-binding protein